MSVDADNLNDMSERRIFACTSPPEITNWLRACAADETHLKNQVYSNPWGAKYDDSNLLLELQNQTAETKSQVQLFLPHLNFPHSSLPLKVLPGHSVSFDLNRALAECDRHEDILMFVRWVSATGAQLAWPVSW